MDRSQSNPGPEAPAATQILPAPIVTLLGSRIRMDRSQSHPDPAVIPILPAPIVTLLGSRIRMDHSQSHPDLETLVGMSRARARTATQPGKGRRAASPER
jgi:hypothetical protein